MKEILTKIKKNYSLILWTIVFYQVLITVITYTRDNVLILFYLLMYIAIQIIYNEYKDKITKFIEKQKENISNSDDE